MRYHRIVCAVVLLPFAVACDSGLSEPEFSIEIASPAPDARLLSGQTFQLEASIVSALDLRNFDVFFAPERPGKSVYLVEGAAIHQGDLITQFRISESLTLPVLEPEASEGMLLIFSPSGTSNALGRVTLRLGD